VPTVFVKLNKLIKLQKNVTFIYWFVDWSVQYNNLYNFIKSQRLLTDLLPLEQFPLVTRAGDD